MTRAPFPVLLLTALVLATGCQRGSHLAGEASLEGSSTRDDAGTERTISRLRQEYTQALLKHDYAALDRLWADELTFINYRGEVLTKAQRMANLRSGATKFESLDVTDEVIRLYGDRAAVSSIRINIKGQYSGQEGSGVYRVLMVWGRPRADWQIVALQMTRVEL